MNKVEKIKAEIERLKQQFMSQADNFHSLGMEEKENHCAILASNMAALIRYIDSLEEEPVSNDLEEAATKYAQDKYFSVQTWQAFKAGAQWQKEQMIDKACEWLQGFMEYSNLFEYEVSESEQNKVINDFKQAMEE